MSPKKIQDIYPYEKLKNHDKDDVTKNGSISFNDLGTPVRLHGNS